MTSKEAVGKIWEAHQDALQLLDLLKETLEGENVDPRLEVLARSIYRIISDSGEAVEVLEALVKRLEIYTSTDDEDIDWYEARGVEEELCPEYDWTAREPASDKGGEKEGEEKEKEITD